MTQPALRRRTIFEIRQKYFGELGISIPLGDGFSCPIYNPDHAHSLAEIFIDKIYAPAFDRIPLPQKWLDIGCHAGYFSLYICRLQAKGGASKNLSALLLDGDSRVKPAVEALITLNHLQEKLQFKQAVVCRQMAEQAFVEAECMSSSLEHIAIAKGKSKAVARISNEEIFALVPPPYDLIKIDVEGSEFEFLTEYKDVLAQTKAVLLEWHSWHSGGGGKRQIQELLLNNGFVFLDEIENGQGIIGGSLKQWGTLLYERGQ